MTAMPTLTDADCYRVHRKRDLLNRQAADAGREPPRYSEPYVAEIEVNDGLGYDLESRQYLRIDGQAYRVARWVNSSDMDGYRYYLERVVEIPEGVTSYVLPEWARGEPPEGERPR